jgi:carboxylate-amine ligase
MLTFGVEEEFLLVGPDGHLAGVAPAVLRRVREDPRIKPEQLPFQVEAATSVCTRLDEVRAELIALRWRLAEAADMVGVRLVAVGVPPLDPHPGGEPTHEGRYKEVRGGLPGGSSPNGTCACHVHVGVPDRRLAAEVLRRLSPWLPVLLGMTVNSPIRAGLDTGWGSARYRLQSTAATARPPEWWTGPDDDRDVRARVENGRAGQARAGDYVARLSPRYPTIEVRLADTSLTVDDSVLLAAVVRALVATLVDDVRRVRPPEPPVARPDLDLLEAARYGLLPRPLADDTSTSLAEAVPRLHERIRGALRALGDEEAVARGLERLGRLGTGAERQRDLRAFSGPGRAFVEQLADASLVVPARG